MAEGSSHRTSKQRSGVNKDRSLEERRRISESLLRRQRGAALNARRKMKLLEIQKEAETPFSAPIIFDDDEMRLAVQGAVEAVRTSVSQSDHLRKVQYLRYLLTDSEEPPFGVLRQLNVVPLFLSELKGKQREIQTEAIWALAFLADGDLASAQMLLPQAGFFVPFLSGSCGFDVAELAAWLFRSMASAMTSESQIEHVDIAGPLAQLVFACVRQGESDGHVVDASMTAAWALCSFVTHAPATRKRLLSIPHFSAQLSGLLSLKNLRILTEATWLITYLVASDDEHLNALIQANVVPQLVKVLKLSLQEQYPDLNIVHGLLTPVLRSIGNIAVGISAEQVKELMNYDEGVILSCMSKCLACDHRGIQKEACKALSNIAAACDRSIIEAFARIPLLFQVLHLVGHSAFDIKREAAFVLANICFNSDVPNVEFLEFVLSKETQLIPGIVSLMKGIDVDTVKLGLDFTQVILESIADGPQRIEEAEGIDALDRLQFQDIPPDLQDLASYLVDTYFGEDYGLD